MEVLALAKRRSPAKGYTPRPFGRVQRLRRAMNDIAANTRQIPTMLTPTPMAALVWALRRLRDLLSGWVEAVGEAAVDVVKRGVEVEGYVELIILEKPPSRFEVGFPGVPLATECEDKLRILLDSLGVVSSRDVGGVGVAKPEVLGGTEFWEGRSTAWED